MIVERSPLEWALLPLQRYAQFSGRAPRAEYWWFYLATIVVGVVAGVIDAVLGDFDAGWVGGIVNLLLLVPTIAVTVRRLHDTNRSGWWLVIGIIVIIGFVAVAVASGMASPGEATAAFTPLMIAAVVATIVVAITLLVFMVLPGNEGPNRYGADPYQPDDHLEEIFA